MARQDRQGTMQTWPSIAMIATVLCLHGCYLSVATIKWISVIVATRSGQFLQIQSRILCVATTATNTKQC